MLTPKQQRFIQEYIQDLNATRAAIRAGYSPKTAESAGSRLLRNVKVAEAIRAAQEAREKRSEVTADRVVKELAKLGLSEPDEYKVWGRPGFKASAKVNALKMLGEHLGIFKERTPLDDLLDALPEPHRGLIRAALVTALQPGGNPPGGGHPGPTPPAP